jgi:cysteine-rich repeat protein
VRLSLAIALAYLLCMAAVSPASHPCTSSAECDAGEACHTGSCGQGTCVPAFTLPRFVVDVPGLTAYTADMISVLDHTGPFYQRCCDTNITVFTGESADRDENAVFCAQEPVFPACVFTNCQCGFRDPAGEPFIVNGTYASPFGPQYLYYASHAGYDYIYGAGTPLVAARDGMLCKAVEDFINGHFGAPTAWEKFHTFYIDHGVVDGRGYAAWYLHAADLAGNDTNGQPLQNLLPGQCAPVAEGQLVATVGNFGTGLPHLHFEMRRYVPLDGPEAASSKVIDPYGWKGATPDPWANPAENPQAETQIEPLWIACGNGRLECGESCDDANIVSGDGCSASCATEPQPIPALPVGGVFVLALALVCWRWARPFRF